MVQSCSTTGRVSATPICGAGRGTGSGTASRDGIDPVTSGSPALSKRSGILAIWLWACCGGASLADFSSAAFSAALHFRRGSMREILGGRLIRELILK